jgi:Zn-finger nucleic acid-binding protein
MQRSDAGRQYRQAAPRCPGCGGALHVQLVADSSIDVCELCGGVWLDPGDGEIGALVAAVQIQEDLALQAAPRELGDCPRCNQRLSDETIREVTLQRCAGCGGRFVPRGSLDAALWLTPQDFARPLPLGAVVAAWLRWLRARAGS